MSPVPRVAVAWYPLLAEGVSLKVLLLAYMNTVAGKRFDVKRKKR